MFRKLTLALGTTVAIGAAALIPTSASAHGHGGMATSMATGATAGASALSRRRPTLLPTAMSRSSS